MRFFSLGTVLLNSSAIILRQLSTVPGSYLHNAARSLSSPSFQLSTNLGNEYTSSQWSKFVDAKLSNAPYSTKFVDYRSWVINRLLDVLVCSIAIYFYSLFAQLVKTYSDNTGT